MFLAEVIGTVVSPIQHPVLEGQRLLLLRPLDPFGEPQGKARIGIDRVSAAPGDRVLVIDEGSSARQALSAPETPVKTVVIGHVELIEHKGEAVYRAGNPADAQSAGQASRAT